MRYNLDLEMKLPDGKQFEPPVTLRGAMFGAMTANLRSDQNLSMDDKLKVHRLAKRLAKDGDVELSTDEVTQIKQRINEGWGCAYLGAAWDLLEGEAQITAPAAA